MFYSLFPSRNTLTNKCCLYWGNKFNIDITWLNVFNFNLIHVKEYKLREFNLKLLYNLIPVKSNLFKWGIREDDLCSKCLVKEDIVHAFIECELNKQYLKHIENILQRVFKFKTKISSLHLLKIECNCQIVLFMTLAFYSIYKVILERNKSGKENRKVVLKHVLEREIRKRIEIQGYEQERIRTKRRFELPKRILDFL